jgi:hypothetical protein
MSGVQKLATVEESASFATRCQEAALQVHSLQLPTMEGVSRFKGCAGPLDKESMQFHVDDSGSYCAIPYARSLEGEYVLMQSDLEAGYAAECGPGSRGFVFATTGGEGVFLIPESAFAGWTSAVRALPDAQDPNAIQYSIDADEARALSLGVFQF